MIEYNLTSEEMAQQRLYDDWTESAKEIFFGLDPAGSEPTIVFDSMTGVIEQSFQQGLKDKLLANQVIAIKITNKTKNRLRKKLARQSKKRNRQS